MTESHQAARRLPRRTAKMLLALVATVGLLLGAGLTAPAADAAPKKPRVPARTMDAVAAMQPSGPTSTALRISVGTCSLRAK